MPKKTRLDDTLATELFHSDLHIKDCALKAQCRKDTLVKAWQRLFGEDATEARATRNRSQSQQGNKHCLGRLSGPGRRLHKGYWRVRRRGNFIGEPSSDYVYEHQLVYCEQNELTRVPPGFHIHHLNGDKADNRIENLVMLTASDHAKLHAALNKQKCATGRPVVEDALPSGAATVSPLPLAA